MSGVEGLERRRAGRIGPAIGGFGLIEPGDRIMLGVSGGKDSWALREALRLAQRRASGGFGLVAATG